MSRRAGALARTLVRIAVVVAVAVASVWLLAWIEVASDAMPDQTGRAVYLAVIAAALLGYALLLALPYVPGIEIGLTILMMQGPGAALPVYLATLLGLMAAFAAGRAIPADWIAGAFRDAGLSGAAALVARAGAVPPDARLALLAERLPGWLRPAVSGWRYPALALILNLPGNWVLGGGGGIMLVAGLSGLFRPAATALTLALAVAPVPLAVFLFGPHPG